MTIAPDAAAPLDETRRRRPVWKPLAAAGLGAAVLVGTSYGVFASLQATANNTTPQTVTSGTLSLTLADNGAGFTQAVSNLAPLDQVNRFVTLTNNGTLAAQNLALQVTATGSTTLVTDGTSTRGLRVTVDSCTAAWTPATNACSGTTAPVLASTPLSTFVANPVVLASAARTAGAATFLRVNLTLPDQTENVVNGAIPAANSATSIQNQTANLTWTFTETQRTAVTTSS